MINKVMGCSKLTCFTPQMAKIAAHHLALFDLNEQEVTLILLCAEHDLFINKVLFRVDPIRSWDSDS